MGRLWLAGSSKTLVLAVVVGGWLTKAAWSVEPPEKDRPVNRLAHETSPYLRQHAHNPVDWYPWGPDAFEKARKENKLIFLSIGYSACHWCHVMERESFNNPEIAKLLNASFVCIKVDREERPEIDQIYQTAAQLFIRQGGWPLSMFLTPDGKPIAGGLYWPPDDRVIDGERVTGFKSVIRVILDLRRDKPKEIQEQSDEVAKAVSLALGRAARATGPEPRRYHVNSAADGLKEGYDPEFGGFGSARSAFRGPKFPMTPALNLLLQQAKNQKSDELLGMVTRTLDHMAAGGIYDQLGGGFHRYSTERTWTVPHFEKMLSDNAQLAELYSRAFQQTHNERYRRVVDETLEFVGRVLTAPGGGFYSSLDADSEGSEGRFYVWTAADIDAALPDPAERTLARSAFGMTGSPQLDEKYFVLTRPTAAEPPDPRLADVRQKLFAARSKRARPFLDTKVVTAWNGQMIAGYAVAGQLLGQSKYCMAATRAADFVLNNLRTIDGRLLRSYSAVPGQMPKASLVAYLDDYAFLTDGLLCLHDVTGDARWLTEAKALTELTIRYYGNEGGGFFYTASDHEKLFARAKTVVDAAQPSGNSVMTRNLLRLAAKTNEARYRDLADRTLRTFMTEFEQNPPVLPAMAVALDEFLAAAPQPPAVKDDKVQPASGQADDAKGKGSERVVKATAAVGKPAADGKQTVTIKVAIENGWHLYANPVGNKDQEQSETTVEVTAKAKPKSVKIEYPKGKLIIDPQVGNYNVYEGTIEIKAVVERAAGDTGPLKLDVKIQACNDKSCLPASTIKLSVP